MSSAPPLSHLRVLDLTDLRGALAGRILGDLGAEVFKLEPPGGDPERLRPPFAGPHADPEGSLPFLFRNANKRGVVVDLDTDGGRERLARLCEQVDVLLENLAPAARARLGLEPAAVRARHPRLVHVVIADCGLAGPRAGWRLEPLPALAASGALFQSGPPERPPCGLPGFVAHDCAAVVALVGALAAVRERGGTGAGQTVEVSVEEAALALLAPWGIPMVDYARHYPLLPPELTRDGDGPAVVVPAADGWLRLLAVTPRQLAGLVRLLAGSPGGAEAAADPEATIGSPGVAGSGAAAGSPGRGGLLQTLEAQAAHAAALGVSALVRLPLGGRGLVPLYGALEILRRVAGMAFRRRPRHEIVTAARRLRVPTTPLHTPAEFVAAEQTQARGFFVAAPFAPLGRPFAGFPCRLSGTPAVLRRGAPALGADEPSSLGSGEPPAPVAGEPAGTPGPPGRPPRGLTGLRVVDLGVGAVVPELCRQLAELGADVVKIEAAGSQDFLRGIRADPLSPNRSWMFNDTARGRRSVCLDLRSAEGRALALRLCAAADVVAENRTAGVVERWGVGYEAVRALRPDVVYVSSQGFGRGGPLGQAGGYGPLAAAFAGVAWLWSHPDAGRPVGTSLEHPDHFAARLLAVAVLAALDHRDRTGEGQHIECAQTEAAAYPLGEIYLESRPSECGNVAVHACPHGVYPAAGPDRWVAIAVVGDETFARFRRVLGWEDDPELATLAGRLPRRPALDARVAAWTRRHGAMAAAAELQAAGVSAMPVQGPCALRDDPHLAARRAFVTVDDPETGPVRHVASALHMGATPVGPVGTAPGLGEHTGEVLAEWLGMRPDEVAAATARG